jgi:acylphosphatase
MKQATIVATGKVQKVRYRSKVKAIADQLGITGLVENLEDGSVRIVAEGADELLTEFIQCIKLKNYLIDVQDLAVSYDAATGEFNGFTKVITGTMYEVAERLDEAAHLLEKLTGAVMSGNDKVIGTIEQGNEKIIGTIERGNQLLAAKQDQTIAILESTKEDTTVMRADLGKLKDSVLVLTGLREEVAELRADHDALRADVAGLKKLVQG